MKIKTSKLKDAALDWAVAKCEEPVGGYKAWVQTDLDNGVVPAGIDADDWLTVGPIIEREKIGIDVSLSRSDLLASIKTHDGGHVIAYGPTPLVAAMRCFVASKLGEEVEVPNELV